MKYVVLISIVLLFMLVEYLYAVYLQRQDIFNYKNSVSNLSIGICERLITVFMAPFFYSVFQYVYTHYSIYSIPNNIYTWIVLLLFTDFVWYWYHRLGHEANLFWAAHIVHHQSEDYNLTIAARITIFQAYVRTAFWCVLPLLGFHPGMVVGVLVVHGAYSFFTHTQIIGKLGFVEHILITPSHHRVHHASNAKYLDKNYGDVFVFWDKMFGTFQKEEEKPVYGLTHPLNSHSFLWQHFHYYLEMFVLVKRQKTWRNKWRVLFGSPTLMDPQIRNDLEKKLLFTYRRKMKVVLKGYINLQLVVAMLLVFYLTWQYAHLSALAKTELFFFVIFTLVNCGAIIEQKKWVFVLEVTRLWQFMAYLCITYQKPFSLMLGTVLLLALINILPVRKWYYRIIYKNASKIKMSNLIQ